MTGKTELANRVLLKLGQPRVSNIETDMTPAAVTINNLWGTVRDALLQSYPWNFSIKRAALAPSGTTPLYDWDNAFPVPIDYLQLLSVKDDVDYITENGKILVNGVTELYIRYIARIEDTTQWPPLFCELLVVLLAIESCERITQDKNLKLSLMEERRNIMQRAYGSDAIENLPEDYPLDEWLEARY